MSGTEGAVNQSTADVAEPIEVSGGDSSITFDDLERVSSLPSTHPQAKGETKKTEPKAEKPEPKAKEAKDGKEKGEEKSQSKNEVTKSDKDKNTAEVPAKLLKLMSGEQEVELRADSLIDVKINGKIEKVPLQDVLNGYSGQSHLTREAQKLKTERVDFDKQRDNVVTAVNHVTDLIVNHKSPREAIYYLAEATGGNPDQIWQELVGKVREAMEAHGALSPEERKTKELEEELSFVKNRTKRQEELKSREAQKAETQGKISQVKEKFGLDDSAYESAVQDILSLGKLSKEQITPELVGQYTDLVKKHEKVGSLLDEVHAPEDSRSKDTKALMDTWRENPGFTEEDMREIAIEVYGNDSAKRLSKKVNKMEKTAQRKQPHRDPQKDPSFFDELN